MSSSASHLQCLCGAVREPPSLLASKTFPISSECCSCNICRHSSGVLCGAFAPLSGPPSTRSINACTRYSRPGKRVAQYFCSKCGCRVFDYATHTRSWFACSGIINTANPEVDVMSIESHWFLNDTGDGGLAKRWQNLDGREIPSYAEGPKDEPMNQSELETLFFTKQTSDSWLQASCHCANITFYILPPASTLSKLNLPAVTRWLSPNRDKYLALNCVCRTDRLSTGFSVASYAYIPPENILTGPDPIAAQPTTRVVPYTSHSPPSPFTASGTTTLTSALPSLQTYQSSPGKRRSFCATCGASVFFESEDRPEVVNVAVGILRAESGALAEDWLYWDWERVVWAEEAADQALVRALKEGSRYFNTPEEEKVRNESPQQVCEEREIQDEGISEKVDEGEVEVRDESSRKEEVKQREMRDESSRSREDIAERAGWRERQRRATTDGLGALEAGHGGRRSRLWSRLSLRPLIRRATASGSDLR